MLRPIAQVIDAEMKQVTIVFEMRNFTPSIFSFP